MKDIGPDATPDVLRTLSPEGRTFEKLKPVPPPLLWTRAVAASEPNISSMLSPIGRTKHAESCPRGVPAFMSVGEFGMNSRAAMTP